MSESFQRGTDSVAVPGHPITASTQTANQGISEKAQSRPDIAGDQNTANQGAPDTDYPEQKHAGKVGYGPNYAAVQGHVTMGERIEGFKEEVKGKLTHNPQAVQEGHDKMSGEAKRRQIQQERNDVGAMKKPAGDAGEKGDVKEDESTTTKHPNAQAEQTAADERGGDEKLPHSQTPSAPQ